MSRLEKWIRGALAAAALGGPASAEAKAKPRPPAVTQHREESAKKSELPRGAFGLDEDGQPFGWGFQNYRYLEGEPAYPDLVSLPGKETSGRETEVRLRQEAFGAFQRLQKEFELTVRDPELKLVGLHPAEGYRTFDDQVQMRKKKGAWAALPGKSEHHLGTAVDITNARYRILYEWLMELKETVRDAHYVPRAIRHGIIPTAPGEPWHYRYVGEKAALQFWEKYRSAIIARHSKLLSNVDSAMVAKLKE